MNHKDLPAPKFTFVAMDDEARDNSIVGDTTVFADGKSIGVIWKMNRSRGWAGRTTLGRIVREASRRDVAWTMYLRRDMPRLGL